MKDEKWLTTPRRLTEFMKLKRSRINNKKEYKQFHVTHSEVIIDTLCHVKTNPFSFSVAMKEEKWLTPSSLRVIKKLKRNKP
jgi:hypothetical protein